MIGKLYFTVTLCVSMAFAQSTPPTPNPSAREKSRAFEVVSIRQNVAAGKVVAVGATPDGFRMVNMPLSRVVAEAYPPQTGGSLYWETVYPAWVSQERYDIEARIAENDRAEWEKPSAQAGMLRAMLQTMLAERCKLVAHRQRKDAPVLYLEIGKSGPKFKESPTDEPLRKSTYPGGGVFILEGGMMRFYQAPMTLLASMLTNRNLGGPEIQDSTGLTGRYDFVLEWGAWTGGMQASADTSDPGPTLFSTVEKLGLKLVPAKGQVETLVIDHIEKPSEN
jgi:bla regulator protein blaR1